TGVLARDWPDAKPARGLPESATAIPASEQASATLRRASSNRVFFGTGGASVPYYVHMRPRAGGCCVMMLAALIGTIRLAQAQGSVPSSASITALEVRLKENRNDALGTFWK